MTTDLTPPASSPLSKLPKYAQDVNRPYVGDPWTRQSKDESAAAYRAFTMFLHMEDRTVGKTKDLYLAETGKKMNAYQWSKRHRWEERALAYDNYLAAKERAALERRRIKAAVKHADQAADALEVLSAPATKLAARLRQQAADNNLDFIDDLDDMTLLKMAKAFSGDLAGLQKAEREALNAGVGHSETGPAPAALRIKGEALRKIMGDKGMVGIMERYSISVAQEEAAENAGG